MFRLQDGLLKVKLDHSLYLKITWESCELICDAYLRLDALSIAFIIRRCSDIIYDFSEFSMKDCSTISSLG